MKVVNSPTFALLGLLLVSPVPLWAGQEGCSKASPASLKGDTQPQRGDLAEGPPCRRRDAQEGIRSSPDSAARADAERPEGISVALVYLHGASVGFMSTIGETSDRRWALEVVISDKVAGVAVTTGTSLRLGVIYGAEYSNPDIFSFGASLSYRW